MHCVSRMFSNSRKNPDISRLFNAIAWLGPSRIGFDFCSCVRFRSPGQRSLGKKQHARLASAHPDSGHCKTGVGRNGDGVIVSSSGCRRVLPKARLLQPVLGFARIAASSKKRVSDRGKPMAIARPCAQRAARGGAAMHTFGRSIWAPPNSGTRVSTWPPCSGPCVGKACS